jgi:hypothetical protein
MISHLRRSTYLTGDLSRLSASTTIASHAPKFNRRTCSITKQNIFLCTLRVLLLFCTPSSILTIVGKNVFGKNCKLVDVYMPSLKHNCVFNFLKGHCFMDNFFPYLNVLQKKVNEENKFEHFSKVQFAMFADSVCAH